MTSHRFSHLKYWNCVDRFAETVDNVMSSVTQKGKTAGKTLKMKGKRKYSGLCSLLVLCVCEMSAGPTVFLWEKLSCRGSLRTRC